MEGLQCKMTTQVLPLLLPSSYLNLGYLEPLQKLAYERP